MAIQQISTSNTFAQWLSTTQQLVEKYNFIEANTNLVFSTANTVSNTNTYIQTFVSNSTNTINVLIANATINVSTAQNTGYANIVSAQSVAYSNVVTIQSTAYANVNAIYGSAVTLSLLVQDKSNTTNTTAQTVFDYVESAFDTANTSNTVANEALVTAQLAFNIANNALSNVEIQAIATASYSHANGAFNRANSASNTAQSAFNTANIANSKVVSITNDTTSDKTIYLLLSDQTTGNLATANISNTKLYFNPSTGTLNSTNYNSLSDERLKNNIITISNPMETIKQIEGVSFNWKDNGNKSYGVIAQELEKVLPELVEGTDVKTVNYTGLIAFLINAIKTLDDKVTQLENRINN